VIARGGRKSILQLRGIAMSISGEPGEVTLMPFGICIYIQSDSKEGNCGPKAMMADGQRLNL
jgi:hypothetical protein